MISPDGNSQYLGAGPVDEARWAQVEFDYIPKPDRMLMAAGQAFDQLPRTQLTREFADTHRLVFDIDAYLWAQHGKHLSEF